MTRPHTDAGSRRVATPKPAPAGQIQPGTRLCRYPGTRVCRWPGRDLLTGARLAPDADVHVVSEYAWYGPRGAHEQATEYGVASLPGLSREIEAGHRLVRMRAAEAAEAAMDADEDDAGDA